LGSSPFARHYSGSRGFFPFLRVLRCFSSPACSLLPYGFRQGYARITTRGFPHSEIPGSKVGQHLPGAYRSRPRPSSALGAKASTVCPCSLDQKEHVLMSLWSFQGAHGLVPAVHEPQERSRSLKTQQRAVEVDVSSRRTPCSDGQGHQIRRVSSPEGRTARGGNEWSAYRSNRSGIPRKEVIQPQLPLRLPCYDFTPIIDPTFDGCLLRRG
jgi:hypothetical protein